MDRSYFLIIPNKSKWFIMKYKLICKYNFIYLFSDLKPSTKRKFVKNILNLTLKLDLKI